MLMLSHAAFIALIFLLWFSVVGYFGNRLLQGGKLGGWFYVLLCALGLALAIGLQLNITPMQWAEDFARAYPDRIKVRNVLVLPLFIVCLIAGVLGAARQDKDSGRNP